VCARARVSLSGGSGGGGGSKTHCSSSYTGSSGGGKSACPTCESLARHIQFDARDVSNDGCTPEQKRAHVYVLINDDDTILRRSSRTHS
jgi:hypothetical protein